MDRFIGLLGIITLLGLTYLVSNNKKRINLRTVGVGLGMQFVLGLLLLTWSRPGARTSPNWDSKPCWAGPSYPA